MQWIDYIEDNHFIKYLFPEKSPRLDDILLHEICLDTDGPSVIFRFDLSEYTKFPPKKWKELEHNTVQVSLEASMICGLQIVGWSHRRNAALSINKRSDAFLLTFSGDFRVLVYAKKLRIANVSGYHNS